MPAALYEATQELLARAGPAGLRDLQPRPARAANAATISIYWRYGDYVGIGPGAHGRLTLGGEKLATRQHRAPETWLAAVERDGHAHPPSATGRRRTSGRARC